jgi:hypothetical protein
MKFTVRTTTVTIVSVAVVSAAYAYGVRPQGGTPVSPVGGSVSASALRQEIVSGPLMGDERSVIAQYLSKRGSVGDKLLLAANNNCAITCEKKHEDWRRNVNSCVDVATCVEMNCVP